MTADSVDDGRRRFLSSGLATLAAARLSVLPPTDSPCTSARKKVAIHPPLGPVKQIHAGVLDVGYVDAGPVTAPTVLLLHGWPYDIHSYVAVARHRSSDHRRLRLRSANSRGHGGPLAGAVTGDRIGERLPDR